MQKDKPSIQPIKLLTPLELRVMNILWQLKSAKVKDLLEHWDDETVPAYNTISTTVRILQQKNYVSHKAKGRSHIYYPMVQKPFYQQSLLKNILNNAFAGSASSLVSALVDNENIDSDEWSAIQALLNKSN